MADLGSSLQSLLQVPGLQQLLNQQMTQQNQLVPLRTAINQQAANMLPNSAFAGQTDQYGRANMASIPQANFAPPAPSAGMNPAVAALLGAGGGAGLTLLLQKLFGNKNGGGSGSDGSGGTDTSPGSTFRFGSKPLANYIGDGLKNLFGGGNQTGPNPVYGPTDTTTYGVQGGLQGPPEPPSWAPAGGVQSETGDMGNYDDGQG